jgi:dTDP-4-dehydrorhamnose reductase
MSRDEFARTIAHAFSLDTSLITNKPTSQLNDIAPRPLRAGFKTDKIHHLGIKMLHLKDALEDMKTCKSIDNVYN